MTALLGRLGLAALSLVQVLAAEEPLNLRKLPTWAQDSAREAAQEAAPAGAEAWVLLERQELRYAGGGNLQVRKLRLVRVIKGRGLQEAFYSRGGLLDGALRIRDLKGWNLRPDGELVKLEAKDQASFSDNTGTAFDRSTAQIAELRRVTEGSLIAFEVLEEFKERKDPWVCTLLETYPVRRWELISNLQDGLFNNLKGVTVQLRPLHCSPWLPTLDQTQPGTLRVTQLPPLPKGEPGCPFAYRFEPQVEVRFLDPQWPGSQILTSWDALGGWYHALFTPKVLPLAPTEAAPAQGLPGLEAAWRRLNQKFTYKQVYLTPDRGQVPETSTEVVRRGYGDCKDLACLFLAMARSAGFDGYPVLARMEIGPILDEERNGPARDRFDHVVAALRLETSLGLPAEVVTDKGRFLLVDPTDPLTPLGWLNASHRAGQLLICLPGAGRWVTVPEPAALAGAMAVTVTGSIDAKGSLDAEVRLLETGNHWGLRSQVRNLTPAKFKEYLEGSVLDQAINGRCEVLSQGDPLDLAQPFPVTLRLHHPGALTRQGSAWVLNPGLGLPNLPSAFTQAGQKRKLPVFSRHAGHLTLQATLTVPVALQPLLAQHSGDTPFRTLSWRTTTQTETTGCTLNLHLDERRKDAFFGPDRLDAAEQAWRADRALVRSLLEDGLALKP